MELYPHNQEAYEKVMAHFESGARKACVIQATGTGKSFVGGAVAEHFDNVLIVAPNNYVLEQASLVTPEADTATYSLISQLPNTPQNYNLIWLDEFHRIGAPVWRGGVDRLLEANPNAKILGTSATPIRSLEQRNMADEFFNNDVVSKLSLTDAWCKKILKVPTYVIGITQFDSTSRDYIQRINGNKYISREEKKQAVAKVNNLARNWQLAGGMTSIFKKYLDNEVRRMIVFAPTVGQVGRIKLSIHNWLVEAGLEHHCTYFVHYNANSNKKQFADFADNNFTGIKVMIAVDMLNEGVHIPDVDCVLLLRSTISKNIYMQQIGRCMSLSNNHKPIILDMADNLSSANGYEDIYIAKERYSNAETSEPEGYKEEDAFVIVDEIKDIREVMGEIDRFLALNTQHDKWNLMLPIIKAEYARLGHLPTRKENLELNKYISTYKQKAIQQRCPERIAELLKMGFDTTVKEATKKTFEEWYAELEEFCKTNKRLPSTMRSEEYNLRRWVLRNKNNDKVKIIQSLYTQDPLSNLLEFVRNNNRLPISSKEDTLYAYMIRHADIPEISELLTKYDYKKKIRNDVDYRDMMLQKLTDFCESKGRLPMKNDAEQDVFQFMRNTKQQASTKVIIDKYKKIRPSFEDQLSRLENFVKENGRLPVYREGEIGLNNWYRRIINVEGERSKQIREMLSHYELNEFKRVYKKNI